MADKIKLTVVKRSVLGRKVKQLRRQGILPANIYGKGIKSLSVQLASKDFRSAFAKAGETSIIDLQVGKETKLRPVLVANIHLHPVTDEYLHVDFRQVDLTKKITANIPLRLIGESPAVSKGGVLIQVMEEVEVEALPTDLPDKFELDISRLEEIGQNIALKDINISSKVKITANLDDLIVKIEEPTKEQEPEVSSDTPETTTEDTDAEETDDQAKQEAEASKNPADKTPSDASAPSQTKK